MKSILTTAHIFQMYRIVYLSGTKTIAMLLFNEQREKLERLILTDATTVANHAIGGNPLRGGNPSLF